MAQQNPLFRFFSLEENQGKGAALARGIAEARGEWILTLDADNATPIEEFFRLAERKGKKTIVIGSRYMPMSGVTRQQPKSRFFLGKIANAIIQTLLLPGISDTQCGFKLFPQHAAKAIFSQQKINRFAFDVEALLIAKNLGYEICEIPVSWFHQKESRIRPVRDAIKTFWDLLRIIFYSGKKEYSWQKRNNLSRLDK